jgi:hypothetical protein
LQRRLRGVLLLIDILMAIGRHDYRMQQSGPLDARLTVAQPHFLIEQRRLVGARKLLARGASRALRLTRRSSACAMRPCASSRRSSR